jgi:multicomponent Na+:H+ antiporter subunit D
VFGGLVLLAGILLYAQSAGSLAFDNLSGGQHSLGWTLILVAFLVNAAAPPLGAWLPDAYPNATVTGAVFLSAFTTKSAIYVLIRGFPGTEVLVWLGVGMALYGMVYAVLENDARRVLAYDIISQLGYMICGIGIGTHMALNGATAHAFAHIFYKALLFMSAGAVLQVTGRRKLSEMGGLYKTMPITMGLCLVGALSISAVPLFSGFVSKSMVVSATGDLESHRNIVFLLLTVAASGTFLHTGLRLPYFMFFGEDAGLPAREPARNMLVAMGIAATACVLIGVAYPLLYWNLPHQPVNYHPYTVAHVTSSLGLLAFTGLGFCLLRKQLQPEPGMCVDTDWFYRRLADPCLRVLRGPLTRFEFGFVGQIYEFVIQRPVLGVAHVLRQFDTRVIDGAVMGTGRLAQSLSKKLSLLVSGNAQHYALIMAAGVLTLIVLAMFVL